MSNKQLEKRLGEGSRLEISVHKLSAKKSHEVTRMDRLLEGYHAEQKETMSLILQQFLLWFETKKNQKYLVITAKAASYFHNSYKSYNPIPSIYSRKSFRNKLTRLLLPIVPISSHQAIKSQRYELLLE